MSRAAIFASLLAGISSLWAGESALTTTFQPLDGLGAGGIRICPVACHDWYSHGSELTAIGLICAPNVPPTNNPQQAKENLNAAARFGLKLGSDDGQNGGSPALTLDATSFRVPEGYGRWKEPVIRATLECLRRCLPENLRSTPVALKAGEADQAWIGAIVKEFNGHDRGKVFYTEPD